jgi:hypothetical protein
VRNIAASPLAGRLPASLAPYGRRGRCAGPAVVRRSGAWRAVGSVPLRRRRRQRHGGRTRRRCDAGWPSTARFACGSGASGPIAPSRTMTRRRWPSTRRARFLGGQPSRAAATTARGRCAPPSPDGPRTASRTGSALRLAGAHGVVRSVAAAVAWPLGVLAQVDGHCRAVTSCPPLARLDPRSSRTSLARARRRRGACRASTRRTLSRRPSPPAGTRTALTRRAAVGPPGSDLRGLRAGGA